MEHRGEYFKCVCGWSGELESWELESWFELFGLVFLKILKVRSQPQHNGALFPQNWEKLMMQTSVFSHSVPLPHTENHPGDMSIFQQTGSPYSNKGSYMNLNIKMMVNKELGPYYSKPWIYLKFSLSGCNRQWGFAAHSQFQALTQGHGKTERMGQCKGHSKEVRGRILFSAIILWERFSCIIFFRARSETVSHLSANIHKAESGWAVFKHSQATGMCMPLLTT